MLVRVGQSARISNLSAFTDLNEQLTVLEISDSADGPLTDFERGKYTEFC